MQYWSGPADHCTVPGCTAATVTISGQARAPSGGMASATLPDLLLLLLAPLAAVTLLNRKRGWRRWSWPVACALLVVAVMGVGASLVEASSPVVGTPVDNVAEAPRAQAPVPVVLSSSATGLSRGSLRWNSGQATGSPAAESRSAIAGNISVSASSFAPAAQSSGLVTTTRTITYTYDPLNRLTGATYSTGESYEYVYDAMSNMTAMTETITSTVATTYLYNSANQLVTAQRSDEGVTWFYSHDRRGNLVRQTPGGTDPAEGETRYTYNSANQPVRVELAGGVRVAGRSGDGRGDLAG